MGVLTQWSNRAAVPPPHREDREVYRLGRMVAGSLIMERLFSRLRQTAPHVRIVTLEGEAGTGKTLAAQTLHSLGPASGAAFVPCTASRFVMAEVQPLLEEARGGTLLLTRVADLTPEQQSRLFDFLEWWEHRSTRDPNGFFPRQIFFSSRRPLRQLSADGRMRADLCYKLIAIRFVLPPLRERRGDISVLAEHFTVEQGAMRDKPMRGLYPAALQRLQSHSWPGNVRELETVISNAVVECEGQWVRSIDIAALSPAAARVAEVPAARVKAVAAEDEDPNLDRMIVRHIRAVLTKTGGNKLRAAQLLGISRSTLYRLLESQV